MRLQGRASQECLHSLMRHVASFSRPAAEFVMKRRRAAPCEEEMLPVRGARAPPPRAALRFFLARVRFGGLWCA